MSFVLAIDQGTTSSRAIVFRSDISIAATAQAGIPAAFSGLGLGRARAGGHLDLDRHGLPRGAGKGRPEGKGHRRDRDHQPARDHRGVGPRHGQAVHRAIVWQDRRTADICAKLKSEGHEPDDFGQDRPDHRSLFLRHQSRLDPRPRAGRARTRRPRRTDVRHRRLLSAVAADRRQGARHRRHQRLAHAAVQHPHRRVGRRTPEAAARAALDAPRGEGLLRQIRRQRREPVRRRDRHIRHRRRPAGRDHRPGLLRRPA